MVAAARERQSSTGRGLQDTGVSDRPFKGEEVDWYACSMGEFHMRRAILQHQSMVESEHLRKWLLLEDGVLVHQAALAMGKAGLKELGAEYTANGEASFVRAKITFALYMLTNTGNASEQIPLLKQTLQLLEQDPVQTPESLQRK